MILCDVEDVDLIIVKNDMLFAFISRFLSLTLGPIKIEMRNWCHYVFHLGVNRLICNTTYFCLHMTLT